ncbi:DUF4326 domain-containing protein [Bartonella sp. LJL80]
MVERIQLKRNKGWKMPENTVKVTRPLVFGNPFICDDPSIAVDAYERLISGGTQCFSMSPDGLRFAKNFHPKTTHWNFATWMKEEGLPYLRGKNLACWCSLDKPCHAEVLLRMANAGGVR